MYIDLLEGSKRPGETEKAIAIQVVDSHHAMTPSVQQLHNGMQVDGKDKNPGLLDHFLVQEPVHANPHQERSPHAAKLEGIRNSSAHHTIPQTRPRIARYAAVTIEKGGSINAALLSTQKVCLAHLTLGLERGFLLGWEPNLYQNQQFRGRHGWVCTYMYEVHSSIYKAGIDVSGARLRVSRQRSLRRVRNSAMSFQASQI